MANTQTPTDREWKREITKQSDECEGGVEVMTWMGHMRDERMV